MYSPGFCHGFLLFTLLWMVWNEFQTIHTSALHVSGGVSAYHQEPIKLYVQPWVLSCFPAVYRWCGWVGTVHGRSVGWLVCYFVSLLTWNVGIAPGTLS
jgi:hypothetical protein